MTFPRSLSWSARAGCCLLLLILVLRLILFLLPLPDNSVEQTLEPKTSLCWNSSQEEATDYFVHLQVLGESQVELYWKTDQEQWHLIVHVNSFSGWLLWEPTEQLCLYNSALFTEVTVSVEINNRLQHQLQVGGLLLDLFIFGLVVYLSVCGCLFCCLAMRTTQSPSKKYHKTTRQTISRSPVCESEDSVVEEIEMEVIVEDSA